MKKLVFAILGVILMCSAVYAEDGVTTDANGNLVIEDVYWKPFGVVNMVIPWKNVKMAYYLDVLYQPANSIIGVEGSIFKMEVFKNGTTLNTNWMLASIVSGDINKGLGGVSFDISSDKNVDINAWRFGFWAASAFDGLNPHGGAKAYRKF